MKPFRQSVAAGLLAALMFSLPACTDGTGNKNKPPDNTTQPSDTTTVEGNYEPLNLPANLNFDGQKIRILTSFENELIMSKIVSVNQAAMLITLVKGAYMPVEIFATAKIQPLAP